MSKIQILCLAAALTLATACQNERSQPVSSSGVAKMTTKVETNAEGHTIEQENIAERYKMDNTPGSVKWLYVISPMTGDVILASSVRGKVTSSGKRLTPKTVYASQGEYGYGPQVDVGGYTFRTSEVLQDDGTYGDSGEYLYWWDQRDQYHQQYISAGVVIHISDKPMHWPKVIVNMDTLAAADK